MSTDRVREIETVIVGGGPAGAALAIRLAGAGREVALFERLATPRWRASGVYSSPLTRPALRELGLAPSHVDALLRPISALVVESLGGVGCVLAHGTAGPAVGVDRVRLERCLLDRARATGADVHESAVVRSVSWSGTGRRTRARLLVSERDGHHEWQARLVVGADGPRSLVARSAGVSRRPPISRAGLSFHLADRRAAAMGETMRARLVFGPGWYCGITPVPRERVNVGIVVSVGMLRTRLAAGERPTDVIRSILAQLPRADAASEGWRDAPAMDDVAVSLPLAHRVHRLAGPAFLLVGDAGGFVDPVTGEGIQRALRSAARAAEAIERWSGGDTEAFARYDADLRSRYGRKDKISWLLQAFMGRPALLEYAVRRLDRRESVRSTFGMVMSDLAPPERALDPRFIAALLAP